MGVNTSFTSPALFSHSYFDLAFLSVTHNTLGHNSALSTTVFLRPSLTESETSSTSSPCAQRTSLPLWHGAIVIWHAPLQVHWVAQSSANECKLSTQCACTVSAQQVLTLRTLETSLLPDISTPDSTVTSQSNKNVSWPPSPPSLFFS